MYLNSFDVQMPLDEYKSSILMWEIHTDSSRLPYWDTPIICSWTSPHTTTNRFHYFLFFKCSYIPYTWISQITIWEVLPSAALINSRECRILFINMKHYMIMLLLLLYILYLDNDYLDTNITLSFPSNMHFMPFLFSVMH